MIEFHFSNARQSSPASLNHTTAPTTAVCSSRAQEPIGIALTLNFNSNRDLETLAPSHGPHPLNFFPKTGITVSTPT